MEEYRLNEPFCEVLETISTAALHPTAGSSSPTASSPLGEIILVALVRVCISGRSAGGASMIVGGRESSDGECGRVPNVGEVGMTESRSDAA